MSSSQSYASRLSTYNNKGHLNLTPSPDPPLSILQKCRYLAHLMRTHLPVVLHTGAGLSTSAGIRDFRGPNGVWTAQAGYSNGHATENTSSFEEAAPTLAHVVITKLYRKGIVKLVVSQNVDGLHGRAGLPREGLAELHGNLFVDWCGNCDREFSRESEATSVGFKKVGRQCEECGGDLTDKALDWEDELPQRDLDLSRKMAEEAGLNVVVGSSCQMDPARGLPFRGGKAVVVNLSETAIEDRCVLTIRAKADLVFAVLAKELGIEIGGYERTREVVVRREKGMIEIGVVMDGEEKKRELGGVKRVDYLMNGERKHGAGIGYAAKVGGGIVTVEMETEAGLLRCKLEEDQVVRRKILTQKRDYSQTAEEEIQALQESSQEWCSRKRKRAEQDWEPRKWFARGGKRGWHLCINCSKAVWCGHGQRERHAQTCVIRQENVAKNIHETKREIQE